MEMALYEYTLILRQDLSSAQISEMQVEYEGYIKKANGSLEHAEYCGLLTLAYPMKGSKRAHYLLLDIKAPPGSLDEMKRRFRLSSDLLRFLEVRVQQFSGRPSPLARSRGQWMNGGNKGESQAKSTGLSLEKPKTTVVAAD